MIIIWAWVSLVALTLNELLNIARDRNSSTALRFSVMIIMAALLFPLFWIVAHA